MVSISKSCKIEKCNLPGVLDSKTGKRYFIKGYCCRHYKRLRSGLNLTANTRFDHRPAVIEGDLAKIPIGVNAKDGYAVVDKGFAYLDKYRWHKIGGGYASSHIEGEHVLMHRMIIKAKSDEEVDHINRDRLDNRTSNLRIATSRDNKLNRGANRNNALGYRGVSLHKKTGLYSARITHNYKVISLGYHRTARDAAIAYNEAVKEYHDKHAFINKAD